MLRGRRDALDARARRRAARQLAERELRAAADHGEQVVEVVRDAARQDAEALEALDLLDVAREPLALRPRRS